MQDSDQHSYSLSYSHGIIASLVTLPVLISSYGNPTSYISLGCIFFFTYSLYNSHSTYGFNANYIYVMKNDEPYIYDTINDIFIKKTGGEIGIKPKVADDFDPLTWHD